MRYSHIRFGDSLPETIKSSAFCDMGAKSHLTWLPLFSPDVVLANWKAPVYLDHNVFNRYVILQVGDISNEIDIQ